MGWAICGADSRAPGLSVKFIETSLPGAYIIELEPVVDERGFFARTWCESEFLRHGLNAELKQCNLSLSKKNGTLRGMHYQSAPHQEAKLIRCIKGAIYDVIIDLRQNSTGYKRWIAVELNASDRLMLYVPEGFAHGFQTLEDNTEVFYQMSEFYVDQASRGIRWNDPQFDIEWPKTSMRIISGRDSQYPDYKDQQWLA